MRFKCTSIPACLLRQKTFDRCFCNIFSYNIRLNTVIKGCYFLNSYRYSQIFSLCYVLSCEITHYVGMLWIHTVVNRLIVITLLIFSLRAFLSRVKKIGYSGFYLTQTSRIHRQKARVYTIRLILLNRNTSVIKLYHSKGQQ